MSNLPSGWNLPPGCFESDLPGWFDCECPDCHGEGFFLSQDEATEERCETCDGSGEIDGRMLPRRREIDDTTEE